MWPGWEVKSGTGNVVAARCADVASTVPSVGTGEGKVASTGSSGGQESLTISALQ